MKSTKNEHNPKKKSKIVELADCLENKRISKKKLTYGCLRDEKLIVFEPGDYLHELLHKAGHAADEHGIIAFHDKFVMYLQLISLLGNWKGKREWKWLIKTFLS